MIERLRVEVARVVLPEGYGVWGQDPRNVFARETAREMLWQGYSHREVAGVVPLDRGTVQEIDDEIDEYAPEVAGDTG